MRLYIDSGTHIDDVDRRVDKITSELSGVDAIYFESTPGTRWDMVADILLTFPVAPLLIIGAVFQTGVVIRGFGRFVSALTSSGGRDQEIVDTLHDRYDAPIRPVDVPVKQLVYNDWTTYAAVDYLLLVFLFLIAKPFAGTGVHPLMLLFGASLLGMLSLGFYLATAHTERNENMVATVAADADSPDQACLIVGEGHHAPVGTRLTRIDGIDVINPTPENPGIITRVSMWMSPRGNDLGE